MKLSHLYRYENILVEYARFMPFGLSIAGAFLCSLHDPRPMNFELKSEDVVLKEVFERGGESVDKELESLVVDIFRLYEKLNVTLNGNK